MALHTTGESPERAVITVDGEVDIESAPQLAAAVYDAFASGRHVVIDLSAVAFLDSSGLNVLLDAWRDADRVGLGLSVVAPPGSPARRILDLTELSDTLVVVDSPD
jgi:anti-anti-sigma factor